MGGCDRRGNSWVVWWKGGRENLKCMWRETGPQEGVLRLRETFTWKDSFWGERSEFELEKKVIGLLRWLNTNWKAIVGADRKQGKDILTRELHFSVKIVLRCLFLRVRTSWAVRRKRKDRRSSKYSHMPFSEKGPNVMGAWGMRTYVWFIKLRPSWWVVSVHVCYP